MPQPGDVNPHNFQVIRVLYDDGAFSVVQGTWQDGTARLGMRWNGTGDDAGYPKTFGNPVWFILPSSLSETFARALLGIDGAINLEVIETLREMHAPAAASEAV